tara:strand:- start:191 stop:406 length:216 start_codon:yes stop_codon:yes gene_type:complete
MRREFAELHPFSIHLFLASKSEIFIFRHSSSVLNQPPVIEVESLLSVHHIPRPKINDEGQIRAILFVPSRN